MNPSRYSSRTYKQNIVANPNSIMNGKPYVIGKGRDSESVGISSKQNTVINQNEVKKEETVEDTARKVSGINIVSVRIDAAKVKNKTKTIILYKYWILGFPFHAFYIGTFYIHVIKAKPTITKYIKCFVVGISNSRNLFEVIESVKNNVLDIFRDKFSKVTESHKF